MPGLGDLVELTLQAGLGKQPIQSRLEQGVVVGVGLLGQLQQLRPGLIPQRCGRCMGLLLRLVQAAELAAQCGQLLVAHWRQSGGRLHGPEERLLLPQQCVAALGQWQVGGQSGEDRGRVVEGRVVLGGSEYGGRRQGEKPLVALLPVDLIGRFQRFVSMLGEVSAVGVFQAGLLFFEAMFQQVRHAGLQGLVDFAVVDQVVACDCGHAGEQRGVIEQPLLHADATVEQAQRGYFSGQV